MRKYLMDFDENDLEKGVHTISLVSEPAMESEWVALKKQQPILLKGINKKEGILLGVAMIPGKPIYRNDENGEYLIEFSQDSVKKIAHEFLKRGNQNSASVEHQVKLNDRDVNVVESWLIEDDVHDKTRKYGINEPVGSWAVKMKVNDPDLYKLAEQGELKGISIEGFFDKKLVNLNKNENMDNKGIVDAIKDGFKAVLGKQESEKKEEVTPEVKLGSVTLKDGETVVQYEGDELVAGVSATVDGEPIPVGRHETEDMVIVVEEAGTIASVEEMEEAEEVDAEKEQIKQAIIEAVTSLSKEQSKAIEDLKTELAEQKKLIESQKEELTKLSKVENPTVKEKINYDKSIELNREGRFLEALRKLK